MATTQHPSNATYDSSENFNPAIQSIQFNPIQYRHHRALSPRQIEGKKGKKKRKKKQKEVE